NNIVQSAIEFDRSVSELRGRHVAVHTLADGTPILTNLKPNEPAHRNRVATQAAAEHILASFRHRELVRRERTIGVKRSRLPRQLRVIAVSQAALVGVLANAESNRGVGSASRASEAGRTSRASTPCRTRSARRTSCSLC